MARRSLPSVVNSRPTTVACQSHLASNFMHSTMTTECDAMCLAVCWCQLRLVILNYLLQFDVVDYAGYPPAF